MLRNWNVFALLVGVVLVGCGGTEVSPSQEVLGTTTGALVTCSTTCSNGQYLSCSGTTCSAVDGSYVQCDGQARHCSTDTTCEYVNSCEYVIGQACAPNTERPCCYPDYAGEGTCFCDRGGTWMCPL